VTTSHPPLPGRETDDPVYSNFDHALDEAVVAELLSDPGSLVAPHTARSFCGLCLARGG
jgi:hypothetical protein